MTIDGEKTASAARSTEFGSSRLPRKRKAMHVAEHGGSAGERRNNGVPSKVRRIVFTESSPNRTNGEPSQAASAEDELTHAAADTAGDAPVIGDAVRARLIDLGASAPRFIASKILTSSDARKNQNRLLLSSKGKDMGTRLRMLTEDLTEAEKSLVNKPGKDEGLAVTALDRHGREYSLRFKFLSSNTGYRFTQSWKKFLRDNDILIPSKEKLKRRVEVKLWAFRSRELPHATGDADAGHPDGALGFLMLHQDEGDDGDEEAVTVGAPVPDDEMEETAAVIKEEEPAADRTCAEKGVVNVSLFVKFAAYGLVKMHDTRTQ